MWLEARSRGRFNVIAAYKRKTDLGYVWENGVIAVFEPNQRLRHKVVGRPGVGEHPEGTRFVAYVEDVHAEEVRKQPNFGRDGLFWEIDEVEACPPAMVPGLGRPPENTYSAGDFIQLLQKKRKMTPKQAAVEVGKHTEATIEHGGLLYYPKDLVTKILKKEQKET